MANKFENTIMKIGQDILKGLGIADEAGLIAEPFVDIAFPAFAPVYNAIVNGSAAAKTAATKTISSQYSDVQNVTAVVQAIEPILNEYAAAAGLSKPTIAQIMKYATALIESMKAI